MNTEFTTADKIEEVNPDYLQLQLLQMEQLKQQQRAQLYKNLQEAREQFKECGIKKTGQNNFQNYSYFELNEIVDLAITILKKNNLSTKTGFGKKPYYMELIDTETGYGEKFESDVPDWTYNDIGKDSTHNKMLQGVGKKESYLRRYLYMQILDVHDTDAVEIESEKHAKNARYKKNKSEALLQKAVKDVKANNSKPERNINDLAGQLSDELAAKGITYNPDTMWEFVNKKFRQNKINKDEFKALKKLLGK